MVAPQAIVADSNSLCRVGFVGILGRAVPDFLIREAQSLASLIEALDETRADLLVLDIDLPGLNGFDGLQTLRSHYRQVKIGITASALTKDLVVECLAIGINGCIDKSLPASEIEEAIATICKDRIYVSNQFGSAKSVAADADSHVLTPQQLNVMEALATGKSNKEIARALGICEGTVKVHVNAAYRALGVHNRVAAVSSLRDLTVASGQEKEPVLPHLGLRRRKRTSLRRSLTLA